MCQFPLVLAFPLGGCADLSISSIELISTYLIKINYTVDVLTDSNYYNVANYSVSNATIRQILPVYATAGTLSPTSNYSLIRINPLLPGVEYSVNATNIVSRTGTIIGSSPVTVVAHNTKTNSAVNNLPSHFNKTPGSVVFGVLSAITRSDEIIGGAFTSPLEF